MNRARNRRRNLALYRYLRATAASEGMSMPAPPWWTRRAGPLWSEPFTTAIRLDPTAVQAALETFLANLRAQLGIQVIPDGYQLTYDDTPLPAVMAPTKPLDLTATDCGGLYGRG